jgi:TRAP-type mannitol/chloroaromatic compound transport system permease large subunit
MSPEILTIGMFGMVLLAILSGVSLAFAMGGTAVIFGLLTFGSYGMYSIVTTMFGAMWSILLSAIRLFVFIGVRWRVRSAPMTSISSSSSGRAGPMAGCCWEPRALPRRFRP